MPKMDHVVLCIQANYLGLAQLQLLVLFFLIGIWTDSYNLTYIDISRPTSATFAIYVCSAINIGLATCVYLAIYVCSPLSDTSVIYFCSTFGASSTIMLRSQNVPKLAGRPKPIMLQWWNRLDRPDTVARLTHYVNYIGRIGFYISTHQA